MKEIGCEEYFVPITPHAALSPEFPVVSERSVPPLPRSSVPVWTTTERLHSPINRPVTNSERDEKSPNNAQWPLQLDNTITKIQHGNAILVGLDIPEIAYVSGFYAVGWSSVSGVERVVVRSCGGASICEVAEFAVGWSGGAGMKDK